MNGKQCNNERLYPRRELGGRGIKKLKDVYAETRVRMTCYMTFLSNIWIEEYGNEKLPLKGSQSKRKQKKH